MTNDHLDATASKRQLASRKDLEWSSQAVPCLVASPRLPANMRATVEHEYAIQAGKIKVACLSQPLESRPIRVSRALAGETSMLGAVQLQLPIAAQEISARHPSTTIPSYVAEGDRITKYCLRGDGTVASCDVGRVAWSGDLAADFDLSWLRSSTVPATPLAVRRLRAADLFAGCGAMSVGTREGARALGQALEFALAAELDPVKADIYKRNLQPEMVLTGPLELAIDGEPGELTTSAERELVASVGRIDVLLGGPPCQGHSDLNNHTRRNDSRNRLVTRMARFAELFSPQFVVIENVQGVRHDRLGSASVTAKQLSGLGYEVEEVIVDCASLGVPQTRRRYILVAALGRPPLIDEALGFAAVSARPVSWALADLIDLTSEAMFDTAAVHSPENERRIRYLFEHNLYDLPDEQRPPCHRTKVHSYRSVYGRMRWDEPAQTITTGFGSTGQGRFVHPLRPRSLTPHEAARLQTLPDFFQFGNSGRTQLQKMIGNSVPPLAMAAIAAQLFR